MTANMSTWPTVHRESGLVERKCPHGIGHPDPDSVAAMEARGWKGYDVHCTPGHSHRAQEMRKSARERKGRRRLAQ